MILITGSAGYLGFHICEVFEKKRIKYIGIDNLSKSKKKNILNKKKFYKLDINSKKLKKIFSDNKINTVIHAAAFSFPPEGEKNKKKYYSNNVDKTKNFINLCEKYKVSKFIFFSSSNVYTFNKKKIKPVNENSIKKPQNFYGKNKLEIENFLKKKKFSECVILRLFNIAGYNNEKKFYEFKNKFRRIIPVISEAAILNKKFRINIFKNQKKKIYPSRDFVHIKDFLKILSIILKKNCQKFLVYNVSNNKLINLNQIVKIYEKKLNKKINFKTIYNKVGNLNYTLGDNFKIKKYLNFKFKYKIEHIINSSINRNIR